MKLSFCEKLLLEIADFIDKVGSPRTMTEMLCWDYYKIRRRNFQNRKSKDRFSNGFRYLKKRGYITKKNLTDLGRNKLLAIKIKKQSRNIQKWDKKWRIVIFDIPEKEREKRNLLRNLLKILNFKKLQASVWISPFDYKKEIKEWAKFYKVVQYIDFILAQQIETDKKLYRFKTLNNKSGHFFAAAKK